MNDWPASVERVAAVLRAQGVDARLEEFEHPTASAREAAEAVGADVAEIVKSLVFVCDGLPVLVLVPGDARADAAKVAQAARARYARMARADEVVSATGFDPGAVAPFPAPNVSRILLDRALLEHDVVWVGAGSTSHVAGLSAQELLRVTEAQVADLVST